MRSASTSNWRAALEALEPAAIVVGVDEVGRGPLAGDVVAAAVVLPKQQPIRGLADSKKLTESRREELAAILWNRAPALALGRASPQEIDSINILQASLLAMQRAVDALGVEPALVLVDGRHLPQWAYPSEAVVGGDGLVDEIAAASIVAKVARDQEMRDLDTRFPQYGFARHKGYPTASHRAALQAHGVSEVHRRSFAPVRCALESVGKLDDS